MTAIHPSLTLILDIGESIFTQDLKLEIMRCYSHIGTPIVRTHADGGTSDPCNVARFIVSMGTKHYLKSQDEGADELWRESVEPWCASMLFKVTNNMAAFNRRARKIGLPELNFEHIDLEFESGAFIVGLAPNPEGIIGRPVAAEVGRARALLNDGTLAGAVRVNAPSNASLKAQRDAAFGQWQLDHPATEDETPADDASAQQPARGPMKHYVGPMPDREKDPEAFAIWEKSDIEAKSYENTAVPPTDSDALPPIGNPLEPPEEPRFSFDVDYSQWDVVFSDGSTRTFNASAQQFVD